MSCALFTLYGSISIHALVKRATRYQSEKVIAVEYFNPRPREEGDPTDDTTNAYQSLFQSTPS